MTTTEFCVRCGVHVLPGRLLARVGGVVFGGEGCPLCGFDSVVSADPPALDFSIEDAERDKLADLAPPVNGARLRWIAELCGAATSGPWTWWTSNSFRRLSARGDGDVLSGAIQRGDLQPDVRCSDADRLTGMSRRARVTS